MGKLRLGVSGERLRDVRLVTSCLQWSTKSYDFTPDTPIEFPRTLAHMCSQVIRDTPWTQVSSSEADGPGWSDGTDWESDYGMPKSSWWGFMVDAKPRARHRDRQFLRTERCLDGPC